MITRPNGEVFTGRENDGTGLYYYRARYYSQATGRFTQEDPIGWASGQANDYAYVGGNPINRIDSFGLASCLTNENQLAGDIGTGAAIGGVIAAGVGVVGVTILLAPEFVEGSLLLAIIGEPMASIAVGGLTTAMYGVVIGGGAGALLSGGSGASSPCGFP